MKVNKNGRYRLVALGLTVLMAFAPGTIWASDGKQIDTANQGLQTSAEETADEVTEIQVAPGKTPLTLEEAVRHAVNNDTSLKSRAISLQQLEDSRERITDTYWNTRPDTGQQATIITDITTKSLTLNVLQMDLNMQSAKLQKQVDEERIAYTLQNLYNDIRENVASLDLLEEQIAYMELLHQQEVMKLNKGMASNFTLRQLEKELEQQKVNIDILQRSMDNLYAQLSILTGIREINRYQAVVELLEIKPLAPSEETVLVRRALASDPYVTIKGNDIEIARQETRLFTYTGDATPYTVREAEVTRATLERNQVKENLENTLEKRITQLSQLEKQMEAALLRQTQLEDQLSVLNQQFELGMIIENDIIEKEMELKSQQKNIDDLEQQHALLRILVEKPYLVPEYM